MSQVQRKRHLERIKTLTLQEAKGFGKKVNQLSSTVPTNSPGEAFTICGEHYSVDGCQLSADICFVRLKGWSLLLIAYVHHQDQLLQNLLKASQSKSHPRSHDLHGWLIYCFVCLWGGSCRIGIIYPLLPPICVCNYMNRVEALQCHKLLRTWTQGHHRSGSSKNRLSVTTLQVLYPRASHHFSVAVPQVW